MCVAWMGVSQDAIIGAGQNSNFYWTRIHKDLLKRTKYLPLNVTLVRKQNAIEKRWDSSERVSTGSMGFLIK